MKLRALVVPQGPADGQAGAGTAVADGQAEHAQVRPVRLSWARRLERVFDIDMQHCPNRGAGEPEIIAAIQERPVIREVLDHLGLDPQPPPKGRAHEPLEPGPHFAAWFQSSAARGQPSFEVVRSPKQPLTISRRGSAFDASRKSAARSAIQALPIQTQHSLVSLPSLGAEGQ